MVSGLAAAALARTSVAGLVDASPGDASRPATLFVIDPRVPQSLTAGGAAVAAGATAFTLEPDVTGLWQHLDDAWRSSGGQLPFAVSGVTAGNVLFVIERLARDYGLRTRYRALHTRSDDGRLRHQVYGTAIPVMAVGSSANEQRQPDWSGLGRGLATGAFDARTAAWQVITPAEPDPDPRSFMSWLLAPLPGRTQRT
jgi:hypothetical protein